LRNGSNLTSKIPALTELTFFRQAMNLKRGNFILSSITEKIKSNNGDGDDRKGRI
jgi:hypothetical protein